MNGIAMSNAFAATGRTVHADERRWTLVGGGLSLAVHLLVATLLLAGLPWNLTRHRPDETVVPVEFIEFAPAPTVERPKSEVVRETKPAPPARPAEATMPIAERPQAGAVPPPKPAPRRKEEPAEKPGPRLIATPRAKPRPPSRFDPARMAALIDRAKKTAPEKPASAAPAEERKASQQDDRATRTALADRIAKASLQAALSAKVQSCWIPPTGAKGAETMQVTLRLMLARDGRVIGMPRFIGAEASRVKSDPFYRIFAESARRAVLNCAPYDDLPPALYRLWREIDFRFDARRMYGSG
ncbi:MAG: hypothetical protein D6757_10270 [Alphaproteobacteria bacterium]|nr:MAG: hypothetical protein D6757_10270 [Alphaproteobacteria bacterium]